MLVPESSANQASEPSSVFQTETWPAVSEETSWWPSGEKANCAIRDELASMVSS